MLDGHYDENLSPRRQLGHTLLLGCMRQAPISQLLRGIDGTRSRSAETLNEHRYHHSPVLPAERK